jgi:GTPase SAR1 family protein
LKKGESNWRAVLVGNKTDLKTGSITYAMSKEAADLAETIFKCPYFETSAKNNVDIIVLFSTIVEHINIQVKLDMHYKRCSVMNSQNPDANNRRQSAMIFMRRLSLAPKLAQTRRFSEPFICNEKTEQVDTESKKRKSFKMRHKKCAIC